KKRLTKENLTVSVVSVLTSAVLYLIFGPLTVMPFWIVGALSISCFIDLPVGLFLSYFFLLQEYHYFGSGLNGLIILFAVSTGLCLIAYFAGKQLFTMNGEKESADTLIGLKKQKNNERTEKGLAYLETFASELDSKAASEYPVEKAFEANIIGNSETATVTAEEPKETVTAAVPAAEVEAVPEFTVEIESEIDLSMYALESSELLDALKNIKKSAYIHSLRVAVLAEGCATDLKFDPVFAKAIGLYHEIGKCKDGDAYENTLSILKENNFPEKLISAVDEVTSKKNPFFTSKEAGVVAITDTIITTYLYLKKSSSTTIAPLKIIDSAMTKYMLNGRLDNAGVTLKDCGDIKNYFLNVLEDLEKKQ
ncbi:MAG: HD domain-containing protein, partial [Lachnospiraceae bacterium]|nr:HD domain-containing protein [Lachnospiraceae bacterium]